ncbi:cobalamin B12-binding domain-containing protein [Maricaulaceae bacterium EIL42A08]|nr:cobalamin B12-binding domain-containing protein [Maricaulaceae bacterium EIL42A08]
MTETSAKTFSFATLAKATQMTLDWRNWAPSSRRFERADQPPAEVLDKLIESEIIPRLMLANRVAKRANVVSMADFKPRPFSEESVDEFARRAVKVDAEILCDEVEARVRAGVSHEDLLLRLLAPAARRLGKLWEEDDMEFTDVTIGLMKLHRVVQRINEDAPLDRAASGSAPRVLLAPALGEQHLLGVLMVGEFFSRAGWNVRCEPHKTAKHLISCVSEAHFDVVGLSASTQNAVDSLSGEIRDLRAASLNPDVFVLVGGPPFNDDVTLARRIGADATAFDGLRAVVTAEKLIHSSAHQVGAPK